MQVLYDTSEWYDRYMGYQNDPEYYGDEGPLSADTAEMAASDDLRIDWENLTWKLRKEGDFPVVAFGHMGLWNGRRAAYKVFNKPEDAFTQMHDDMIIGFDGEDMYVEHLHHDGTNHFEVRGLKEENEVDEKDRDFWYDIRNEEIYIDDSNMDALRRITFSLKPYFADYINEPVPCA